MFGPQLGAADCVNAQMATFLTYLSTPEEGGETVFPLEGRDGLARLQGIDYKRCDMGFKVRSVCLHT